MISRRESQTSPNLDIANVDRYSIARFERFNDNQPRYRIKKEKTMRSPKWSLFLLALALAAAISLATGAPSAAVTWVVDQPHTEVNFSVKHFFTPVTGSFDEFEIKLDYDAENPASSRNGQLVARGLLTIKGQSREIDLPITLLGKQDIPEQMQQMLGGTTQVASFKASTAVDRNDYGVGVGNWAATLVVGGDVSIEILLEAHRK
jgi:polyisoprenoid-binding protein YceI